MNFTFNEQDIVKISALLESNPVMQDGAWLWQMADKQSGQAQTVIIHGAVDLGGGFTGPLIAVQTKHGYFELHGCTHYLLFEPDEVIFLRADETAISSMVIGKKCTCSMFAPIRRELLSEDMSNLDPAVLMSAMQLSIAESIL